MSTLLLSDLHLPAQASPLREMFLRFLQGPATNAAEVYLLGDLFEAWIGDDVGLREYATEIAALRALRDRGVAVFVQHGNRDFLLASEFEQASGATLLGDPEVRVIQGQRTLLTHGDLLCTDDVGYQRWRRWVHKPWVQGLFRSLPLRLKQRIAGGARDSSRQAKRDKPMAIMDVNADAVHDWFRRYEVDRLIHGHTHRPDRHLQTLDGRERERIVLPDWRADRHDYLEIGADGSLHFHSL